MPAPALDAQNDGGQAKRRPLQEGFADEVH
jgi:hypothetical protein